MKKSTKFCIVCVIVMWTYNGTSVIVTFDTPIPNYGSVEIESNIDMSVNNAFVNFATNVNKIR